MKAYRHAVSAALLGLGMAFSLQAQASLATSWTLTGGSCTGCGSYGNTRAFSGTAAGSGDVTASAWADTGSGASLQTAELTQWSGGLGAKNRAGGNEGTAPNHAVDNEDNFDSVLFAFDQAVTLDEIVIGWWQDADLTLLAYTGSGTPDLAGQTYAGLDDTESGADGGWSLVGDYFYGSSSNPQDATLSGGQLNFAVNAGNVSSSYWLVSALNPAFNAAGCSSTKAIDCAPSGYVGNDYFKIYALAGSEATPPPPGGSVPAPATLALLALGLPLLRLARKTNA